MIDKTSHVGGCWGPTTETAGVQTDTSSENCLVCKATLDYFQSGQEFTCMKCNKTELGYVNCPNGHYICDSCHGEDTFDLIYDMSILAKGINPFLIANEIIDKTKLPMLGCEHAWVAAGALIAAIRNEKTIKITDEDSEHSLHL